VSRLARTGAVHAANRLTVFDDPHGSLKGIISASYSLGAICSLPFIPIVNDRLGRRGSIFLGSSIMLVGAIIQGCAKGGESILIRRAALVASNRSIVGMYIAARLILGFGIPTCIVSGSSLIGELAYPKERPVLTSFFNTSYYLGSIVAAGITFGTNSIPSNWAWRIPSFLQICPSLLQLTFVFLLPESPRW
jgi:MFS family permease